MFLNRDVPIITAAELICGIAFYHILRNGAV
jgi:hypothetical protein